MPIDAETQAALDAISATVTQHRQQAVTAVARLEGRIDAGLARMDALEDAAQRLRRALRDGRFDGESGSFVDALASALGMSVNDVKAGLVWVAQERRKAR